MGMVAFADPIGSQTPSPVSAGSSRLYYIKGGLSGISSTRSGSIAKSRLSGGGHSVVFWF